MVEVVDKKKTYKDSAGRHHETFALAFDASVQAELAKAIEAEITGLFGPSEANHIAMVIRKKFIVLPRR